MKSVFLAGLVAMFPGIALCQNIPRFDVDRWCNRVASSSGSYSDMLKQGCMQQEQDSYDALKSAWMSLPQHTRSWCTQVGESPGGSYMIMNGCVQQEQSSAERNAKNSFQY